MVYYLPNISTLGIIPENGIVKTQESNKTIVIPTQANIWILQTDFRNKPIKVHEWSGKFWEEIKQKYNHQMTFLQPCHKHRTEANYCGELLLLYQRGKNDVTLVLRNHHESNLI